MSFAENVWNLLSPSVLAAGLVVGIGYLFRDGILKYVGQKITLASQKELQSRQHQFKEKIDEAGRDFEKRQSMQQRFLTSFLEVSSQRVKAVSKREIEAAEAIWASVNKLNALIMTAKTADLLKFDAIENLSALDREKLKDVAKVFTKNATPEFFESVNCNWARLYVNDAAWAFYHAYSKILLTGVVRMIALATGMPLKSASDDPALSKAILEALPHQKPTFEKFPDIDSTLFLEELRQALLSELRKSINGEQSTDKEAEKARAILNALPTNASVPSEWQVPPT